MDWNEQCQNEIDKTLASVCHREVFHKAITKLIEAKIEQALYNLGLAGASFDPNQAAEYQERLLAAVVDELHKDKP